MNEQSERFETLVAALRRIADEMQSAASSGRGVDPAWLERRIKVARRALALAAGSPAPEVSAMDEGQGQVECACGAYYVTPGKVYVSHLLTDGGFVTLEPGLERHTVTMCTRGGEGRVIRCATFEY